MNRMLYLELRFDGHADSLDAALDEVRQAYDEDRYRADISHPESYSGRLVVVKTDDFNRGL